MPIVNERYYELRSLTHIITGVVLHFDRNILVWMVLRVVRECVVVLLWTLVHGGVYRCLYLNRLQGGTRKKLSLGSEEILIASVGTRGWGVKQQQYSPRMGGLK
jgi:hypothetical protein